MNCQTIYHLEEVSMSKIIKSIARLLVLFAFFATAASAKNVPTQSSKLVNDYTGILSPTQVTSLERMLVGYFDSTSTQIAVVIERSLEGDDIFDYCQRLATTWGIGEKGKNNGLLLYIAIDDRKVRIHTGYGMEATITDALSKRIVEETIVPNFRNNNHYQGIYQASVAIIQAASGEYTNNKGPDQAPFSTLLIMFVLILVFIFLSSKTNKNKKRVYGNGVPPMMWGGTFGRGGFSSGGGFGGFGGGSFGGGGASGSW
jgi:uncharacterized protein